MNKKMKYYSLDRILEPPADYNFIYGERSNGKTSAILRYGLAEREFCLNCKKAVCKYGTCGALMALRRSLRKGKSTWLRK